MKKVIVNNRSEQWCNTSSSMKKLHQDLIFEGSEKYNFPLVDRCTLVPEDLNLISFHDPKTKKGENQGYIHFFIDDYYFESIWSKTHKLIEYASRQQGILSPTFSVYDSQPMAMNIWNTYRNRWITKLLQVKGFNVIPVVTWCSTSLDFSFEGLPTESTLAVSTVGCRKLTNRTIFKEGFYKMLEVLKPTHLVIYGDVEVIDFDSLPIPITRVESDWKKKRRSLTNK